MKNRREFIRTALLSGLGISALKSVAYMNPGQKIDWSNYGDQFDVKLFKSYLNTGTMGLSPLVVQNRYIDVIRDSNSTGRYAQYEYQMIDKLAEFINCTNNELCITRNVTEGINITAWSVPLKKGDEVILTKHEHAGNAIPWMVRAEKDELKIKIIELGKNGAETLELIKKAVTRKTRVIAVPHIPCTVGHILPIKEICDYARANSIYSCIDGAHGPGMLKVDVQALGCDFYASCFHKWMLGPKGMGFLYVKKDLLPHIQTYFSGEHTTKNWSFSSGDVEYHGIEDNTAHRYRYGTQSDPQHAAALSTIEFIEALGIDEIEREIRERSAFLTDELKSIPNLQLLVSDKPEEIGGIVSFKHNSRTYLELYHALTDQGFRIRGVPESGVNCLRISTHIYNSFEEIELFVTSLKGLVK
ncbi:aminotransferase class V-fold PLP-dependent enzyme [bacterium]|nr:aminotransferase class V-fold PLP-dependent enzyme [bacterium]